jgi:hypothetical protein
MPPEPTQYDLQACGIETRILIIGSLRILLPGTEVPVVFLVDETHAEDCINQNLLNAEQLTEHCRISFAGVESRYGGYKWDDCYRHQYTKDFDLGVHLTEANTHPQFADGIGKFGVKVFGVESEGLSGELLSDLSDNPPPPPMKDRAFNVARSEHFIRTLFQLRVAHCLDGNIILNVGGNHNTHIAQWIGDGSIETKVGHKAAYIRLRAPAYKE